MSTMQRSSILRCVCCDVFGCWVWPVYDRDVLTESRTNPYNAKVWPYLTGILIAGAADWPGLDGIGPGTGSDAQKRTGCTRLVVWRNRELLGTSAADMHFDDTNADGSEDHVLQTFREFGAASAPFYAPGDATKTPLLVKPYWWSCLEWGAAAESTAWAKPSLDDVHDYLKGDQGIQGEATWWNLDPGNLVLGGVYDLLVQLSFYKRAISGTITGGGSIDWTYQAEEDGYAVATSVGIERVS